MVISVMDLGVAFCEDGDPHRTSEVRSTLDAICTIDLLSFLGFASQSVPFNSVDVTTSSALACIVVLCFPPSPMCSRGRLARRNIGVAYNKHRGCDLCCIHDRIYVLHALMTLIFEASIEFITRKLISQLNSLKHLNTDFAFSVQYHLMVRNLKSMLRRFIQESPCQQSTYRHAPPKTDNVTWNWLIQRLRVILRIVRCYFRPSWQDSLIPVNDLVAPL